MQRTECCIIMPELELKCKTSLLLVDLIMKHNISVTTDIAVPSVVCDVGACYSATIFLHHLVA